MDNLKNILGMPVKIRMRDGLLGATLNGTIVDVSGDVPIVQCNDDEIRFYLDSFAPAYVK